MPLEVIKKIKDFLARNPYINLYFSDTHVHVKISLIFGIFSSLFYAVFNMVAGIIYSSFWLILVFVYYALVLSVRYAMLRAQGKEFRDRERCRTALLCGIVYLLLFVTVSGMIAYTLIERRVPEYKIAVIIVLSCYAGYTLSSAAMAIMRSHYDKQILHRVAYTARFVTALMSAFNLFVALLPYFEFADTLSVALVSVAGIFTALIVLYLALTIIINSTAALRKQMSE